VRPPLFEAVPNFSEGKDATKISRISEAVRAISGVRILGLHSDPDHNRSVLTFAGGVDSVLEGAIALAKACAAELDLASQSGVHPRMGVLDVLPFVPLEGANMDDAVRLAHRAGESLGSLGFPVYLYGSAATTQYRRSLPDIRRGGYEGVASRLEDPLWKPDYGPKTLDPHRGAVAVGARPFLVAFNAYLDTDDVEVARAVARKVRESGGKAQVSMNLTDLEQTPIPVALEAVRSAASGFGASVESTELVGLAPLEAVLQTARYYLGLRELDAHHVLEWTLYGQTDSRSL
jgi:glutamate formiminotransferase / 5-formyltetrahydrofolate cyclo-ligase